MTQVFDVNAQICFVYNRNTLAAVVKAVLWQHTSRHRPRTAPNNDASKIEICMFGHCSVKRVDHRILHRALSDSTHSHWYARTDQGWEIELQWRKNFPGKFENFRNFRFQTLKRRTCNSVPWISSRTRLLKTYACIRLKRQCLHTYRKMQCLLLFTSSRNASDSVLANRNASSKVARRAFSSASSSLHS